MIKNNKLITWKKISSKISLNCFNSLKKGRVLKPKAIKQHFYFDDDPDKWIKFPGVQDRQVNFMISSLASLNSSLLSALKLSLGSEDTLSMTCLFREFPTPTMIAPLARSIFARTSKSLLLAGLPAKKIDMFNNKKLYYMFNCMSPYIVSLVSLIKSLGLKVKIKINTAVMDVN